jgi:aryl-alcohol dehydrogenase-like predicted oxidoreductase
LARRGKEPETVVVRCELPLYAHEVDTVTAHLAAGQAPSPCMTWADSLGQQHSLDRWRESVGLVFDAERDETALSRTVSGRPLARRRDAPMRYGQVAGIGQPVARLVMGTMIYRPAQQGFANALLDYYVELGGNAFDTAHVYGGGGSERTLGQWIEARGLREKIVVLTKGAHHNADRRRVTPFDITSDLHDSLARLRTDYIDLYVLHRDDPSVPVGPIVEILNEHRAAGRIHAFGGSNWSLERIQAANEYAEARGLTPFAVSSPNYSLAEQVEEPWPGCTSLSGPQGERDRAWFAKTQMPLFTWSSLAQGFFSGRFTRETFESYKESLPASCLLAYCHPRNFDRLDRAHALAREKGATVPQIALAFIASQPLHLFALIGVFRAEECRANIDALNLRLTPEELDYLDLKRERPR